ncbi:lipopolysaccharide assembly LapA domain-containing protein [Rhodoferax sp.]|uniref:LapA family protein n=1 Tax=Rhodoferax sp. TaxID=50421 RepID=UPI001EBB0250|nr:LapA family protein [Rhodoferax sp.]MBT9507629.1 LapA family protein [Rhodoferax sp.]
MKHLMWLLKWILKAAIFFTLFAFALNNQQDTTVHFFFGTQWRGPQVLVVLTVFTVGVFIGVLGMVPRWWKHRRVATRVQQSTSPAVDSRKLQVTPPPHGL